MRTILLTALAASALATAAAPASAGEVTFAVDLAGLDLSNAEGIAVAHVRIDQAVARACSVAPSVAYGAYLGARQECEADGRRKAVEALEARAKLARADAPRSAES